LWSTHQISALYMSLHSSVYGVKTEKVGKCSYFLELCTFRSMGCRTTCKLIQETVFNACCLFVVVVLIHRLFSVSSNEKKNNKQQNTIHHLNDWLEMRSQIMKKGFLIYFVKVKPNFIHCAGVVAQSIPRPNYTPGIVWASPVYTGV
jgi:hypothetical protein